MKMQRINDRLIVIFPRQEYPFEVWYTWARYSHYRLMNHNEDDTAMWGTYYAYVDTAEFIKEAELTDWERSVVALLVLEHEA